MRKVNYLKQCVDNDMFDIVHVYAEEQKADIMTKGYTAGQFESNYSNLTCKICRGVL